MKSKILELDDPVMAVTDALVRRLIEHNWYHNRYHPIITQAHVAEPKVRRVINLTDWSDAVTTFTVRAYDDYVSIRVHSGRDHHINPPTIFSVRVFASSHLKIGRIISWCEHLFARRDIGYPNRMNAIRTRWLALLVAEREQLQVIIDAAPADVMPRMVAKMYPSGSYLQADTRKFIDYMASQGVVTTETDTSPIQIPAIRETWPKHLAWATDPRNSRYHRP